MRILSRPIATLVMAVCVATCSDAPTGPLRHPGSTPDNGSGGARARVGFEPVFSKSASTIASRLADFGIRFDRVRIVIVRPVRDTVADTTVTFLPGQSDLTLDLTVDVKTAGEIFTGSIDYRDANGVLFHGEQKVQAHAPDQPAPPEQKIVVEYVGPGSNVARIAVSPKTTTVVSPATASFSISAFDANNSTVPLVPVNWVTSDPTVATIDVNGTLRPTGKRGTVTVTATTPKGITDNASAAVSLPASGIILIGGDAQTGKAGTKLTTAATVRVVASDGGGVAGTVVNFAAPVGGAVAASSVTTDPKGEASTFLTLAPLAGPQAFAAAAGSFSVTIPATATAADPAGVSAEAGSGQADTVRHALKNPLVVKVTDQFKNPVPNAVVSWTHSGGGVLGAATSTTNASGLASVGFTLGAAVGSETVVASVGGASASFSVEALPATPTSIVARSGSGQTGRVGQPLAAAFVVTVADNAGNPVDGATIHWTATNGSIAVTTISDGSGTASALMTLGATPGSASATASIAKGGAAVFTATVQPGAATKLVIGASASSGTIGAPLAPAVRAELQDAAGNQTPATNDVTIALGANAGGATLGGTRTRAAVAGVATFDDLTIDKSGIGYTLVVSSTGATSATTPAFTVSSGVGASMVALAGDGTTATVNTIDPASPAVKVVDASGVPIAGVAVTFTPDATSGTVVPTTPVTTNAAGVATLTSWTVGTLAGTQSLAVSAPGVPGITIRVQATPGAAAKLAIATQPSASATSGAALTRQPVVQVHDQFGNLQSTAAVQVTATPSVGTATNTSVTSVAGVATYTGLTITATATATVVFSAPGLQSATSESITFGAAIATKLQLVGSASVTYASGAPPTVSVKATDAAGNPVSGVQVTIETTRQGQPTPILSTASATTGNDGVVSIFALSAPSTTGVYVLTATAASIAGSSVAVTATVTPGTPAKLAFSTQPSAVTAGSAQTVRVEVRDAAGNLASSATTAVSLAIDGTSSAVLSGGAAVAAVSGVATFSPSINLAGSYQLVASAPDPSPAVASATSVSFTVSSSSAVGGVQVSTAPPSTIQNSVAFTAPAVQLLDGSNHALTLAGVSVAATAVNPRSNDANLRLGNSPRLPPGPAFDALLDSYQGVSLPTLRLGSSTVITAVTNASGIATFTNLSALGYTQDFALRFTVASSSYSVTSDDIHLGPGPAVFLDKTAGDNLYALIGAVAPTGQRVQLQDTLNQNTTYPTTAISFTVQSGGGSVGASASTNSSGYADANWTLGSAEGTNQLSAGATLSDVARSVTFTATAADVHAMQFSATPASSQTIGVALPTQPTIQLTDASGHSLRKSGVIITASVGDTPPGNYDVSGSLSLGGTATATTNASGLASFTNLAVYGLIRPARLTFTVTSATSFSITAITRDITLSAGAASSIAHSTSQTVSYNVSGALQSYPAVVVNDVSGNHIPNSSATVSFSVTSGSCSISGGANRTVNGSGVASITSSQLSSLPSSAGSCTIQAASGTLTNSPLQFFIIGYASGSNTWLGAQGTSYSTTTNWSANSMPASSDQIFVPKSALNQPVLSGNAQVTGVTLEPGASIDLQGHTFTVANSVDAGTVAAGGGLNNGTLQYNGTSSSTLRGPLPTTILGVSGACGASAFSLVGKTTTGPITLNCPLTIGSDTLTTLTSGGLTTAGANGKLIMSSSSGRVIVAGAATFGGADPGSSLAAGTLEVKGDLVEEGSSSTSFAPSSGFIVKLNGSGAQSVNFTHPGGSDSRFDQVIVANTSTTGVTFASDVNVVSQLDVYANSTLTIANGAKLSFGGSAAVALHSGSKVVVHGTVDSPHACQRDSTVPPTLTFDNTSASLGYILLAVSCSAAVIP